MKRIVLFLTALFTTVLVSMAANRTVQGVVVSAEDGEPLIGATVMGVDTNIGSATNIDGQFTLSLPENVKHIRVSFVGMHTREVAITTGEMRIELANSNQLDEVIAVAYGTAKRSTYTGSAAVVNANDITDRLVTDVTSVLNGTVAGVQLQSTTGQPGEEPKILIRGVGSINASTTPLYVVDGIPYDGGLNSINPQDVQSISVLKDAASAALYGARGANGVILVTTKRGQAGAAKVTFDARWGANSRQVSDYETIDDIPTYYSMYYRAINRSLGSDVANTYMDSPSGTKNAFGYQMWTIPAGEHLFLSDGSINPNATLGNYDTANNIALIPDNWKDGTYSNGLRQEYNLSVSGGNDRMNYMVSGSYLDDSGIIQESDFKRFTTRASVDYQAKSWLKIGTNMSYTYQSSNSPYGQTTEGYSANASYMANFIGPMYPMYLRNADGSFKTDPTTGRVLYDYGMKGLDDMTFSRTFMSGGNPTGTLVYDKQEYLHDVFNGKWYAQITPFDGMTVTGSVGYWMDWERYNELQNNRYGQLAMYGGSVTQETIRNRSINLQLLANYVKTFNKVHNFDFLVGYESYDLNIADVYGEGQTIFSNDNYTLSNVIDNFEISGSVDKYATRGYFARVNYDYDSKYFGSVSYRRDASSRFAKNHRWGNFWSVSAAWDIAKEDFMNNAEWVDMLKVKASFGQQGNDNVGNYYPWANQYTASGSDGVWSVGPLYYKGNPDLTWETSNSFNAGVDFALFNSRFIGTVEYFSRQTSDMLYYRPTATSLGYDQIPMNIGSMRNNGLELDLTYQLIRNKNIDWSVSANLTYVKNKVLKLAPELNGTWISGSRIYQEGESMYQIYCVKYAGVDPETGNALYWARRTDGTEEKVSNWYIARNGDEESGYVANRQASGNMLPPVYGGISTNLKVYGFDFGVNCGFQLGGKIIDSGYQYLMSGGYNGDAGMALHKDLLNAWTTENTNTNIPALAWSGNQATYMTALTDRWLTSSNYFSLNNITAGYTLPKSVTSKLSCTNIRVYFSGDNLYLWSKRKGLDPRQGYVSSIAGSYSALRSVSGGVKIEF
jgi:TonB-linked SusC/RagA family outer membrane protein